MYPETLPEHSVPHHLTSSHFPENSFAVNSFVMRDYSIGMHSQEFYEINIVLSGNGRHYINNGSIKAVTGNVFIIPPMVKHGYVGGEGFDVFHLLISPDFWNYYVSDFRKLPSFYILFDIEPAMRTRENAVKSLILNKKQLNEINELIARQLEYGKDNNPFNYLLMNSSAVMMITKFCMIYSETAGDSVQNDNFIKSLSLIYRSYNEKITIKLLAETALMSRTAYINYFVKVTGMTPVKFLTKHRLTVAKGMLADTEYSLETIASMTGFYDTSHFVHSFKDNEDCSPTEFRRKIKEQKK